MEEGQKENTSLAEEIAKLKVCRNDDCVHVLQN